LLVLLTKSDKLGNQRAALALKRAQTTLIQRYPFAAVQLFSAVSGVGVRAAQTVLRGWLE
jgi:GTP-binding protein EngB required for normal cell division